MGALQRHLAPIFGTEFTGGAGALLAVLLLIFGTSCGAPPRSYRGTGKLWH